MSLSLLTTAPPSGRLRPVVIDDVDYSTAIIRQGSEIPWTDLAALAGHFGQVQSLLGSDVAWIDVSRWQQAHLTERTELLEEMGARSRRGRPLRTLLADPALTDTFGKAVTTISDATRRPVVLRVPSPGTWLDWAHTVAGVPLDEVDLDGADAASMYVAEWLGQLGALPVLLVILDATAPPAGLVESLADYSSIVNVADHFGWSVALRHPDRVETTGDVSIGVLADDYWGADAAAVTVPDSHIILTTIPASSSPEGVLDKLKNLG